MFPAPYPFCHCKPHNVRYPAGAMCPRCECELAERKKVLTNWKDIVPLELWLDYIQLEPIYCRDEEHEFRSYDGTDTNKKEHLRMAALEKREEFLQIFIRTKKIEE